jgi:hypothetical protein
MITLTQANTKILDWYKNEFTYITTRPPYQPQCSFSFFFDCAKRISKIALMIIFSPLAVSSFVLYATFFFISKIAFFLHLSKPLKLPDTEENAWFNPVTQEKEPLKLPDTEENAWFNPVTQEKEPLQQKDLIWLDKEPWNVHVLTKIILTQNFPKNPNTNTFLIQTHLQNIANHYEIDYEQFQLLWNPTVIDLNAQDRLDRDLVTIPMNDRANFLLNGDYQDRAIEYKTAFRIQTFLHLLDHQRVNQNSKCRFLEYCFSN